MFKPRNTLLKDVELNIEPDCPIEYLHSDGTVGIICDQDGFEFIVAQPFYAICRFLYDLNVRTVSCGSNAENEMGITIDYESLSEMNKKYADLYMQNQKVKLDEPSEHMPFKTFRVSVEIDKNNDTIASAQKRLRDAVVIDLCLEQQDVLYGRKSLENELKKANEENLFETLDEFVDYIEECGQYAGSGEVWASKELYEKHKKFQYEQLNSKKIIKK